MTVDYEQLLQQAREGAPRSLFTKYMDDLCKVSEVDNLTRVRLLGNAIANSRENAAVLAAHPEMINALFEKDPLGLQVLYNGAVNNFDFCKALVGAPGLLRLKPSPAARNLLGTVFEVFGENGEEISNEISVKLASNGFLELIAENPSLETEPLVVKHFPEIYASAQQITTESLNEDEINTLGIRVVGNISSHNSFGIEEGEKVANSKLFTWDTVALLANLTAKLSDVPKVAKLWPNMPLKLVELIKSEEAEEDDEEQFESEDEEQFENMDDGENLDDDDETPFDLQLWGTLLRNICRNAELASEVAKLYKPAKLYRQLASYPATRQLANEFLTAVAPNYFDSDFPTIVLKCKNSVDSVLMASAVLENQEAAKNKQLVQSFAEKITESLLNEPNPEIAWVRGTKTLAVAAHQHGITIPKQELSAKAPKSESVQTNIAQIK